MKTNDTQSQTGRATERPWTMFSKNHLGIVTITGGVNPSSQQLIFEPCKMDKANAALIVEAVNQFEALKEVANSHANLLKMIEAVGLRPAGPVLDIKVGMTLEAAQHVQENLAKVKGEGT